MATRTRAEVRLKLKSDKHLSTIIEALRPEATAPVTRRATVKLERDGLFLILTAEADDTVALRSMLNAYLRWINSIINAIDMVEQA